MHLTATFIANVVRQVLNLFAFSGMRSEVDFESGNERKEHCAGSRHG